MARKIRTYSANSELVLAQRTKLALSAADLFSRKGYHNTRVQDIVDSSGMGKGTIYHYVGSKRDILSLIFLQGYSVADKVINEITIDMSKVSPIQALKLGIRNYYGLIDEYPAFARFFYQEIRYASKEERQRFIDWEHKVVGLFEDILRRGSNTGEFAIDNVTIVANTIVANAEMWAVKRWLLREHFTAEQYIDEQIRLALKLVSPNNRITNPGCRGKPRGAAAGDLTAAESMVK